MGGYSAPSASIAVRADAPLSSDLAKGLVDRIGGFRPAVDEAKELAGLDPRIDVGLLEVPPPKPIGQQLAELFGAQVRSQMPGPPTP